MDDESLLQYKEEYFGRFILNKPTKFADINQVNLKKFPGDFFTIFRDKKDGKLKSEPFNMWAIQPIPKFDSRTFYNMVPISLFPDKLWERQVPKKISIIKHGEYTVTHKLTNTNKTIYELLCIFPEEIEVPHYLRYFNFYGFPEWFEPFVAQEEEYEHFLRELKKKFLKKY